MPERPTLDGIRQASAGAFGKAKLMVGLKNEEDLESQHSETSSFLDEAVDLMCPDLSFQQVSNNNHHKHTHGTTDIQPFEDLKKKIDNAYSPSKEIF